MKKLILSISILLAIAACSDNDDSGSSSTDIFMKATVGSQQLNVTGSGTPTNTQGATSVFQISNTTFYLTGNNGVIILSMAVDKFSKSTGTFTLGDINSGRVGNYADNTDKSNPINYYSKSGTLTITKFDGKTVEGTFSFTAFNKDLNKDVIISGGQFKVPYTEI